MTELYRGLYNFKRPARGGVVTIGNFDGVHIGHQALITKLKQKAKTANAPALVITFEPQPLEFFLQDKSVPRLTRWREKFLALANTEIDGVLVLRFNDKLATLSADEFVEEILYKTLAIKHIIVGDDFRFGHERKGDFAFLKKLGEKFNFTVEAMPGVLLEDERVSSTRIRNELKVANHTLATKLLGRNYTMKGRVVQGDKLGRQLGFPTANIFLHRRVAAVAGVYIVRMQIEDKTYPGVANIGTRPAVGGTRALLEVHLFNFNQDIYGKQVCVEFCEKLRNEENYPNLELLRAQIAKDAEHAREYFKKRGELNVNRL